MRALGHKSINNTVRYTHLVHFNDDEFYVATATTVGEAKELAKSGLDYTTMNGIQIFRKPKMFSEVYVLKPEVREKVFKTSLNG